PRIGNTNYRSRVPLRFTQATIEIKALTQLLFFKETHMLEVNQINLNLVDLEKRIEALRGYL
ncbi:hypothetical protein, partial [Legionella steigerwaltii]|uniref:hypothetical protein n=1 Tax=Legionella steigerwaltii TaxID=460 RepID=UPI0039ED8B48